MKTGRWITLALVVVLAAAFLILRQRDAKPVAATVVQQPQGGHVRLEPAVTGLQSPVHLAAPAGDARLFIVEQVGRIRIARQGRLDPRPFLDLTDRVGSGGERGLLSVAFHPDYARNGRFFVNYTDRRGDTHVAEFHADPSADTADRGSERRLLFVRQPYANHNGGHILFGPDGGLYVGMGDGGAAGDPHGNAQDDGSQLGKLLRIDVDRGAVTTWAKGLRNPWRLAFDSGLIYIADVGQGTWEEIDVAPASQAGLNYGWRAMEGAHCYLNPVCGRGGYALPAAEYSHDHGCSVTGGVVYRGRSAPALAGLYLYSDYCEGGLRSFRYVNGAATEHRAWDVGNVGNISSYGVDGAGEVYLLSHDRGIAYRIAGN